MFNAANTNTMTIVQQVQTALVEIRAAMATAEDLHAWSAGISLDELTAAPPNGPGMTQADAQDLLSACADANGLAGLYNNGSDPRSVPAGYVYGASQRRVIGPRAR